MSGLDIAWNSNCDLVEEYGRQSGTCNCPYTSKRVLPDGQEVKFGRWLKDQIKYKKGGRLPPERDARIQALVDAGKLQMDYQGYDRSGDRFQEDEESETPSGGRERAYSDRVAPSWEDMYDLLVAYGRREKTCDVPWDYVEVTADWGAVELGKWVTDLKRNKSTLTEAKMQRMHTLVNLGLFQWDGNAQVSGLYCLLIICTSCLMDWDCRSISSF